MNTPSVDRVARSPYWITDAAARRPASTSWPRYTHATLQDEADRWVEKLRAKGFRFPDAPIMVFTNGRQHDTAAGLPRGRSTGSPSYLFWARPDEYDNEFERGLAFGMASRSKHGDRPLIYIRLQLPRWGLWWSRKRAQHDVLNTLIHELLHHTRPRLPHWKVYALAEELSVDRDGVWTAERIIRRARSRADLARLRAELWTLDNGWPAPTLRPTKRPTATTPPPARSALGRFMFKQSDADADGTPE